MYFCKNKYFINEFEIKMSFIDLKESSKKEESKEQIINQPSLFGNYAIITISLLVSIFFSYSYFNYGNEPVNIIVRGTIKDSLALVKETHGIPILKIFLNEYPYHIFSASKPEISDINLSELLNECKNGDSLILTVNKYSFDQITSHKKLDYLGFYELKSDKNTYLYGKTSVENQKSEYKFGAIMFGLLCVFFIFRTIKIKKATK